MEGQTVNAAVQTSATGANFVAVLAANTMKCTAVRIHNNTGVALEVKRDDETVYIPVQDKDKSALFWVSDPNRLSIRRIDQSNTQVTAQAEILSF
jgi:outer membrane lipoprotein SlyB